MSRLITRTIYGSALQTSRQFNLSNHVIHENSTLNAAVDRISGINTSRKPFGDGFAYSSSDINQHVTRFFCIGNGAHVSQSAADGAAYPAPVPHRTRDAAPFSWLPFLMRSQEEGDIPATTLPTGNNGINRSHYGMRRFITVNGVQYVAYYLKRLSLQNVQTEMQYYTVNNGVVSDPVEFVPTVNDLEPVRPTLSNDGSIPNSGTFFSAAAKSSIKFTSYEIAELLKVAEILHGTPLMAIISEIGLVSGVERSGFNEYNFAGASAVAHSSAFEVVGAQVTTWISTFEHLAYITDLEKNIELGATEPEFGIGA